MGLQLKFGGKFHLKLNTGRIPIANKYREGKMKRALKRGLKVPEIAEIEPIEVSVNGICMHTLSVCLLLKSDMRVLDCMSF